MSALDALASLGLTINACNGKIKMTGLEFLSEGQAQYAVRLAHANKAKILYELSESQNALAKLLAHLRQAPGINLHFYAVEPVPAFTLEFDDDVSYEDRSEAQTLFHPAVDAIHFNAKAVANLTTKMRRTSAFEWPE